MSRVEFTLSPEIARKNPLEKCKEPRSQGASEGGVIILRCYTFVYSFPTARLGVYTLFTLVDGQRYKSEPPFGEKPLDQALLIVPAVATGAAILAWRLRRGPATGSTAVEQAPQLQT